MARSSLAGIANGSLRSCEVEPVHDRIARAAAHLGHLVQEARRKCDERACLRHHIDLAIALENTQESAVKLTVWPGVSRRVQEDHKRNSPSRGVFPVGVITTVPMPPVEATFGIPNKASTFTAIQRQSEGCCDVGPARVQPGLDVLDDGGRRLNQGGVPDQDLAMDAIAEDLGGLYNSCVHRPPDRQAVLWSEEAGDSEEKGHG